MPLPMPRGKFKGSRLPCGSECSSSRAGASSREITMRVCPGLSAHPEWYNELTRNCTTTIEKPLAAAVSNPQPWNYQFILNGTVDELL